MLISSELTWSFIAPLHAVHVRPSNASAVSKRMGLSSLFDPMVAASFLFLEPTAVTKLHEEPLSGSAKCTGVGKFSKFSSNLSRKWYDIGPYS